MKNMIKEDEMTKE